MYGICTLSTIPCRKEASHRSEMVNMLLFGEFVEVLSEEKDWLRTRCTFDQYEGYIERKQLQLISNEAFEDLSKAKSYISTELVHPLEAKQSGNVFPILLGSTLPTLTDKGHSIGDQQFIFDGSYVANDVKTSRNGILETACLYLDAPYLWGGRSPFGIDCSGLIQMVFKLNGMKMPRDAWQQAETGTTLSFIDEAEPGDLAFFDNKEGKITHVGIIMSNKKIIHASGKVRIDDLDHQGIYTNDEKSYSHNLRLVKRVI